MTLISLDPEWLQWLSRVEISVVPLPTFVLYMTLLGAAVLRLSPENEAAFAQHIVALKR